ncbi:MAG TPA: hypothetical protein VND45_11570 [Thermoanaerobaculia bacterium]|jgi:hypothetical protein|nr:hypothetical protein [Thermoanaerobaculia bacterium]
MELTPTVVIAIAVIATLAFVLIRRARRAEAAAPVNAPRAPLGTTSESGPLNEWLLDRAFEQTGFRVADDPLARQRVQAAAVKAMDELRTHGFAEISLPFLIADATGPKHFNVRFKRTAGANFEVQH